MKIKALLVLELAKELHRNTQNTSKDEQSLKTVIIFSLRNTEALVSSKFCLMRAQLCALVLLTAEVGSYEYQRITQVWKLFKSL